MNIYIDPRLLDVAGAMNVLANLPLDDQTRASNKAQSGTDPQPLVPLLVPTPGNQGTNMSTADKISPNADSARIGVSVAYDHGRERKSRDDKKRANGLKPSTFSLEGCEQSPSQEPKTRVSKHLRN